MRNKGIEREFNQQYGKVIYDKKEDDALLDAIVEFIDEEVMEKIRKLEDRIEDLELEIVTERKIK